jgi:flagellar protein FlaI
MTKEIAALLWLCMQYELNILVAGGTASGKTSILNALMPFIPPNHRIISIEDTRELRLPDFLHWIPLTTREPNPEGKGEVSMLDLLVNSLRMRPDRVVVGEIRRENEAEVLFEAMHTGHSVYATLHADRAEQVIRRLTNPPINVPESMLESLHLVIVQYRHRRLGIRRTLEVAEFIPGESGKFSSRLEILYRWKPTTDTIEKARSSIRLINEIRLHTGMTDEQMESDLKEKEMILQWMLDNNVRTVNTVGKVVAEYYHDRDKVLKVVKTKGKPEEIIGKDLAEELKTAV